MTKPIKKNADDIRARYKGDILLLTVSRLTKYKRPELSIRVVEELKKKGVNAKLIILGKGELTEELKQQVSDLGLEDNVFMPGFVNNVLDYMAAADFLIHPSLLESSCITFKEAALVNLPSIVCRGIGDFDEVVEHESNGFLIDTDDFVNDTVTILLKYKDQKKILENIGYQAERDVRERFDIQKIARYYERTFHNV